MDNEERISSLSKVKELFPNLESDVIEAVFDEIKNVENTIDHLLLLNTNSAASIQKDDDRKLYKMAFTKSNWNRAVLDIPDNFLRLNGEGDESDEFALMLQNEEFLNELRFNKDFLMMLGNEGGKFQDESLEEKLKNMGRKKFLKLAKLFQRTSKKTDKRRENALLM